MSSVMREVGSTGQQGIFGDYAPPEGVVDEMFSAPALARAHATRLVSAIDTLGRRELARRWEEARRVLHENGITYNVHGDPQGMDRPWELDALPLVVAADQWASLSAALVQRAR